MRDINNLKAETRVKNSILLFSILFIVCFDSQACSTPVFRYALENWQPSLYTAFIAGAADPGNADQKAALERLAEADKKYFIRLKELKATNAELPDKTTDDPAENAARKLALSCQKPSILLYYPEDSPLAEECVSLDLTRNDAVKLLDSPAREKVAAELLSGVSAVFVMLGSDKPEDDLALFSKLEKILASLPSEIQLSDMAPHETVKDIPSYSPIPIKIAFSAILVPRSDERESVFSKIVRKLSPDTPETESLIFPVIGRGRLIATLRAKDISKETLSEICQFMAGPCSCLVKAQNPGIDLPFSVDWDSLVFDPKAPAPPPLPPPPLAGIDEFVANSSGDKSGNPGAEAKTPPPSSPAGAGGQIRFEEEKSEIEANELINIIAIAAIGLLMAIAAFILVLGRGRK